MGTKFILYQSMSAAATDLGDGAGECAEIFPKLMHEISRCRDEGGGVAETRLKLILSTRSPAAEIRVVGVEELRPAPNSFHATVSWQQKLG